MRETTIDFITHRLKGYNENPELEVLSISQQQGQPDTWLVVVKDHRPREERAVYADQVLDQDDTAGGKE